MKTPLGTWPSVLGRRFSLQRARHQVDEIELTPEPVSGEPEAETATGGKPPWRLLSFILIVILPFLASFVYFVAFASDQYTAETRFAVRSVADEGNEGNVDSGILSMQLAGQDAHVVTSFIHSTEILRRIGERMDLRSVFIRSDADRFSRFDEDGTMEDFLKYWKSRVSAYIDGPSGIVTVRVRSFRPEDSVAIATAILEESEKLINELSDRARSDIIRRAEAEVDRTSQNYSEALNRLNQFQQEAGLLSPAMQAQESGKLLTGLLGQRLDLDARLFVLQQSNVENSPAYEQLSLARQSLDTQIAGMRSEMTGADSASIAGALVEFSKLDTNRLVAEKFYEVSRKGYEAALVEASRKALYLVVFVRPALPEEALYPRRFMTPLMILLGLIVLWSTLSLAWASVEDHRL